MAGRHIDVYCLFFAAAGHLGSWQETSAITFGKDGKPFYIQGPHDDPNKIMRTLTGSVSTDNFHFSAVVGASSNW